MQHLQLATMVATMTVQDIWVFLLLGIGTGAAYAIAGVGLVQIYRGSGVINFAHGGIAFMTVALYGQLSVVWDWPWVPSFLLALAASLLAGALIQLLVMHPLRHATVLVKIIATVGVLAVIEEGVPLLFGNITQTAQNVDRWAPSGGLTLQDGAVLGYDRIIMTAVAVALGYGMWALMGRTRFGLETTAVAEDPVVAEALRVNPGRVALLNWTLGGGLAGLAGLLWSSWTGLRVEPYILLVVPALAAALIGRFDSFPATVFGGLGLGMVRELIFRWQTDPDIGLPDGYTQGWNDAVPFLVIIVLLAVRGSAFPERGEIVSSLPAVGRARLRPLPAVVLALALGLLTTLVTDDFALAVTATAGIAIVGLSLVVVTGLAGQISLAQMAMAGLGALVAAQLSSRAGVPFLLLLPIAVVVGATAGAVFALPALRTRGPTLAVATIALGLAVQRTVFGNSAISGGSFSGLEIDSPSIFGWDINGVTHPARFASVAVVALIATLFLVSNLRAGPLGRRFLAVRSNERAAAALGISVSATKLAAFSLSAGIAALGGIFLVFNRSFVQVIGTFNFGQSLLVVVFALIGGIGFLLGPVIGGAISPAGLIPWVFNEIETIERLLVVVAGLIVIVQLIIAPDGIVQNVRHRQRELATLRAAVGESERRWRQIGAIEIAGGAGVLLGIVGERFDPDLPFEVLRTVAMGGIAMLLVAAIKRHRDRGHPLTMQIPPIVLLVLTLLGLGLPRVLSPLLDAPDDTGSARAIGLWLGLAVLVGTVGLHQLRRRRSDAGSLPLPWMLGGILIGLFLISTTFGLDILNNLFGLIVGLLLTVLGVGKIKTVKGHTDRALDFEIDDTIDRAAAREAALHIDQLTVRYGPVTALDGLSLTVEPGRIVGLIGPNGAGKTTAIDAISGFVTPTAGSATLGQTDIMALTVHDRARAGLGRTFQTVEPFDDLTVVENLAAAAERIRPIEWLLSLVRVPALRLSTSTGEVIEAFELGDELSAFPSELPQGRRRLLGVARAMANAPATLLLDEPAAGLSRAETEHLGQVLQRVARDLNVGMLLVEHDMSIVTAICDHVVALDFGRQIYSGPPDLVLTDPAIRSAYLGEDATAASEPGDDTAPMEAQR